MRPGLAGAARAAVVVALLGPSQRVAAEGVQPPRPRPWAAALGGGFNVDHSYAAVALGRRFGRAPYLSLHGEYAYNQTISAFPFHTLGLVVRTRFAGGPDRRLTWFHHAGAGLVVSVGDRGETSGRDLGQRLLGATLTQGLGLSVALDRRVALVATVATGTPVWLRTQLLAEVTW